MSVGGSACGTRAFSGCSDVCGTSSNPGSSQRNGPTSAALPRGVRLLGQRHSITVTKRTLANTAVALSQNGTRCPCSPKQHSRAANSRNKYEADETKGRKLTLLVSMQR